MNKKSEMALLSLLKKAVAAQNELWDALNEMESILGVDLSAEEDIGGFSATTDAEGITIENVRDLVEATKEQKKADK